MCGLLVGPVHVWREKIALRNLQKSIEQSRTLAISGVQSALALMTNVVLLVWTTTAAQTAAPLRHKHSPAVAPTFALSSLEGIFQTRASRSFVQAATRQELPIGLTAKFEAARDETERVYAYYDVCRQASPTAIGPTGCPPRHMRVRAARTWATEAHAPKLVHHWLDVLGARLADGTRDVPPFALGRAGTVAKLYVYVALPELPLTASTPTNAEAGDLRGGGGSRSQQTLAMQLASHTMLTPGSVKAVSLEWDIAPTPRNATDATYAALPTVSLRYYHAPEPLTAVEHEHAISRADEHAAWAEHHAASAKVHVLDQLAWPPAADPLRAAVLSGIRTLEAKTHRYGAALDVEVGGESGPSRARDPATLLIA